MSDSKQDSGQVQDQGSPGGAPSPGGGHETLLAGQDPGQGAAKTLAPVNSTPSERERELSRSQVKALMEHSFKKGKSGNPGGRPKAEFSVRHIAREYGKEAIEKLVTLMRTAKDQKVQRDCAVALLDRGYGKVLTEDKIQATTAMPGDDLTDDDLDKMLDA